MRKIVYSFRLETELNALASTRMFIERVRLDQVDYQFLFADGDMLTFMHLETFEQIELNADLVGEPLPFLQENMEVTIELYEEEPISISLPESVVLEVTEADAVVKGQTASSSYKPAMLENGVKVMVPPHIEAGTKIVVNTAEGTYMERAK